MIYAYELSKINAAGQVGKKPRNDDEFRNLKKKVGEFLAVNQVDRNQVLYKRILERLSLLGEEDIHLLLSIYKHLDVQQ